VKTKFFSTDYPKGFTLVELLVVVATLFVLGGLIVPALAAPKNKSAAAGCLANLHELQNAWCVYKDDNNDVMIPCAPLGVAVSSKCWVNAGSAESWDNSPVNTNVSELASSLITPYIGGNIAAFKCPADVVPSANWQRLRSYSMNGQMGVIYEDPGYDAPYRTYVRGSDLTCPTPANAFIFLDEHPMTLDDAWFQLYSFSPGFADLPASYHEGCGGFSFADGHVEMHQWQTTNVLIPVQYGVTSGGQILPAAAGNPDWIWLNTHGTCLP